MRINNQIRVSKVRLIGAKGEKLGIFDTKDALKMAIDSGLDLVEVSSQSNPSVCKILNYGKYKFDQKKRTQEAQKKTKKVQLKEIKLRPKISEHDYQFKLKHVKDFLLKGDKVKVSLQFRGREMVHRDIGDMIIKRLLKDLPEDIFIEKHPVLEGRQIIMIVSTKLK